MNSLSDIWKYVFQIIHLAGCERKVNTGLGNACRVFRCEIPVAKVCKILIHRIFRGIDIGFLWKFEWKNQWDVVLRDVIKNSVFVAASPDPGRNVEFFCKTNAADDLFVTFCGKKKRLITAGGIYKSFQGGV